MLTFKNDDATGIVKQNLGEEGIKELDKFGGDFLPFPELDTAVKEDVEFLKGNKAIPESVKISGWVYQVEDGKVRSVV